MIVLHKVDIIKFRNYNPHRISHPVNQIASKITFRNRTMQNHKD